MTELKKHCDCVWNWELNSDLPFETLMLVVISGPSLGGQRCLVVTSKVFGIVDVTRFFGKSSFQLVKALLNTTIRYPGVSGGSYTTETAV